MDQLLFYVLSLSLSSLLSIFLFSPGHHASLSRVATPVYQVDGKDPFDGIQLDLRLWLLDHSQLLTVSQHPIPSEIQNPLQSTTFIPSSSFQVSLSLYLSVKDFFKNYGDEHRTPILSY